MSDSISRRSSLAVYSEIPGARIRRDFLLACARHGLRKIRGPVGEINFILVSDRRMARLHREYTGIAGTTDVLTFDLTDHEIGHPTQKRVVEGDIYICLDQARRQAREYGVPLYEETARLAVHGVLHLAGYDDQMDTDRAKMRRLEDQALEAMHHSQAQNGERRGPRA